MTTTESNIAVSDVVAGYRKESRRLLAQVDVELERGRLNPASQALWDAAANGLKAAAARRGWPHDTVVEQMQVVSRLIDEEGGPIDLNTNAIIAHSFNRIDRAWETPLYEDDVEYGKGLVANLLNLLTSMD